MARVIRSGPLLKELMLSLDKNGHPGYKLPMVGTLRSTLAELWAYEAVVDKWPDYSSVILRPDEKNTHRFKFVHKNIYCYGENAENFAQLVNQPNVLPWHKSLLFHAIPLHLVDSVASVVTKNGGKLENRHGHDFFTISMEHKDMGAVLEKAKVMLSLNKLPAGFTVGSLRPEHAELILDNWTYAKAYCGDDTAERESWIEYLRACIQYQATGCVYDKAKNAVSWQIQHLYGCGGLGNTLPEYFGFDLFGHTLLHASRQMMEKGEHYFGYVAGNNKYGMGVTKKYGVTVFGRAGHRFYSPSPAASKL